VQRLIRKLEAFAPLSEEEKAAVLHAGTLVRHYGAHADLIQQGSPSDGVKIILEGLACRYKVLPDGRRQIVAYFVPGDLCDLLTFLLKRTDYSIGSLCPVEAAVLSQESLFELTEHYPNLTRALWCTTLVDEAIEREWLINVGHRTALERMAHLFCEIFVRLQAAGLTQENRCELPLTQTELADTLALSAVHVNRTLMDMRRTHLVTFHARQLIIHDQQTLRSVAGFDPAYLHLGDEMPVALRSRTAVRRCP